MRASSGSADVAARVAAAHLSGSAAGRADASGVSGQPGAGAAATDVAGPATTAAAAGAESVPSVSATSQVVSSNSLNALVKNVHARPNSAGLQDIAKYAASGSVTLGAV